MSLYIINTIAPVFLVLLAGYLSVKTTLLTNDMIDGLMKFAIYIAVPCLLFQATSVIDLGAAYNWRVILAFFGSAVISFACACLLVWKIFNRRPGQAVAVGFSALFSNLILLGLPITQRALGENHLSAAVAIVSVNAPICYLIGISVMEIVRADGRSFSETTAVVVKTMFQNSLMIGIGLGFIVNLSGIPVPAFLNEALNIIRDAALPVALFALGGILTRYSLKAELNEALLVTCFSLLVHPFIAWQLCSALGVDVISRNIVVLMASVAPGINSFLFANMYERGQGTAVSIVLLSTMLAVVTVSTWLWLLAG